MKALFYFSLSLSFRSSLSSVISPSFFIFVSIYFRLRRVLSLISYYLFSSFFFRRKNVKKIRNKKFINFFALAFSCFLSPSIYLWHKSSPLSISLPLIPQRNSRHRILDYERKRLRGLSWILGVMRRNDFQKFHLRQRKVYLLPTFIYVVSVFSKWRAKHSSDH